MGSITENWKMDFLFFVLTLVTVYFLFAKFVYSYWERKNFKTLPNVNYFVGHLKSNLLLEKSFTNLILDLYKQTTEPFIGMYGIFYPILFVRDPVLIQSILVKDFNNFASRGMYSEESDPPSCNMFFASSDKWKNLRRKLSPAFTSSRLKTMFSTYNASGAEFQSLLERAAKNGESVDIKEIAARYATDNITSIAFGIKANSISDPNDEFRKFGYKTVEPTIKNAIRFGLVFTAPKLMKLFSIRTTDREIEDFFFSVVKQNLEHRKNDNVIRNDVFNLLKDMTLNEIVAQFFVFFLAGFESSANTLAYCLLELAKQPDLQKRVQSEIDCVLDKHNGELTHETFSEMKLLDNCTDGE